MAGSMILLAFGNGRGARLVLAGYGGIFISLVLSYKLLEQPKRPLVITEVTTKGL